MVLSEGVALPHCERESVKLEVTHDVPLRLPVTEEEEDGVHEGECDPLGLPLAETQRDAVAHALCVAHPLCERVSVKLEETHEEPLRLPVTEEEK